MPVAFCLLSVCLALGQAAPQPADTYHPGRLVIVAPAAADWYEQLAAAQLRRYAWLRTGELPTLAETAPDDRPAVLLRTGPSERLPSGGVDPSQNHAVYVESWSPLRIVVHGAAPVATLWAAYTLVESWGVGFYLGGDALPPPDPDLAVPPIERQYAPALAIRGSLPWFNFLNSPTTWNPQDYLTFFNQLSKQKANFVGFHVYDHEPFCGYNIGRAGATMGGPLMTTISPHRWWSPAAMCTKDFLFGTDLFFERGEWGCEVGIEDAWAYAPGRAVKLQQRMMAEALHYAGLCGLKTCIGFEATGNPDDPRTRAAFKARLRHTLATYPLDYFWVWQSEGRGTGGRDEQTAVDADIKAAFAYLGPEHDLSEAARITKFVRLAHETLKELTPEVRLIVSGWGGDEWMRFTTLYEGLDQVVPDDIIFAALDNIDPRLADHVSQVYGRLRPSREAWPIPWFESDAGYTRCDQTGPQTNVTAFEPLLKDIIGKKCRGALGIHWRTRNVEDVAGYLYRFAWNPELTPEDFFRQYAGDHYGPEDAEYMTQVHLRLEEYGPQYTGAVGCVECYTPFTWFHDPGDKLAGRTQNVAGHLPIPERLNELDKLAADLGAKAAAARQAGREHAARQYHDLSATIQWLVARSRAGLAIAAPSAPLEKALREAERLAAAGNATAAQQAAIAVLKELATCRLADGFRALATTCRTRGELGMLATANARYGRSYASFVERAAGLLPANVQRPRLRDWEAPESLIGYPVPDWIPADRLVRFDLVAATAGEPPPFRILVKRLPDEGGGIRLSPRRLARGCYRVALSGGELASSGGGGGDLFHWRVYASWPKDTAATAPAPPWGAFAVTPAIGPCRPAFAAPAAAIQHEPTLELRFEKPLDDLAEVIGEPRVARGIRGKALDLRSGGLLKLPSDRADADFDGPFTIAFFARPEPWDRDREMPVLLGKGEWQADGWFVQLYRGRLRVSLGENRLLDAGTLAPGRWTHVAVVFDGDDARVYLDAKEIGTLEGVAPPGPSDRPLLIGGYREPGEPEEFPFRGCLDEITLYRRALSEAELREQLDNTSPAETSPDPDVDPVVY